MRLKFFLTTSILAFASLTLTGCGIAQRKAATQQFQAKMDGFVGQPFDDVIRSLGVPTNSATLTSGGKVYEYARSRTETGGGGSYTVNRPMYVPKYGTPGTWVNVPTQQAMPISSYEISCRLLIEVSAENKVLTWKADGNGCY